MQDESAMVPTTPTAPAAPQLGDLEALTGLKRPKWQRFVVLFASGMDRSHAATAAGYSEGARNTGHRLMKRPEIRKAVQAVRDELARRAVYDLDKLVRDLDEAADFARQTENATALVRARELKGKALGLLVDRIDARVQQVPFRIEIAGIDSRPSIDGEAAEVPDA